MIGSNDIEDIRLMYELQGFVHLKGVIPSETLAPARAAFNAAAERSTEAHFFLEDLAPDQGCLAFIPGSYRYPAGRPKSKIRDIDASDVAVKTVPRAGDVVIFNTHVMHMATDNRSGRVRKSIIYAYSHYWIKNYASGAPSDLDRYAITDQRKQLFGVDIEGIQHIDRRLDGTGRSSF